MGGYILRRLLLAIPTLLVVSVLIFGGVRVIPGDTCRLVLGTPEVTEEQCDRVEHSLGLDRPVVRQYLHWLAGILTGDFGNSMINDRPVWGEIQSRLPTTIELALLSTIFAVALALPVGVYSAVKQNKPTDVGLRLLTIVWLSMPSFWLGTMLITFPAKWWGYSPPVPYVQFFDNPLRNLQQMYLPAIALGLALGASLARLTRSSVLEVLRQDYVRTARAKGLPESTVLRRHALKNAMLPVITLLGLQLGFLLGGTVVLESLFALPGLGTLLLSSAVAKDFTQIQGLVILFAIIIIAISLLVDLSYALFDPRVRFS
jgi:peptide/nickel transport system permease protein